jgi:hypothetical protein
LTLDPGWKKIRIRDKHPGSATLVATFLPSLGFRLFAGQVEALLGVGGEVHSNDKKYRVMVCFFLISVFEVVDVVLFPVARGRPLPPGDEAPGSEPGQDVHVLPGRHHQQPGLQGHHLS